METKSQTLADTDPGTARSSRACWMQGNPRFPDLVRKPVWRERYDTIDPPAVILLKGELQDEQVSVGVEGSGNGEVRGIDVGQGYGKSELSDLDPKRYKFVFDGVQTALKQANLEAEAVVVALITLPGYTHSVISLPYLVDKDGEIDPVSICDDGRGGERLRRGCFVEIKEGEKTHGRVFIVERKNSVDTVTAIDVKVFNLTRAMDTLICSSHDYCKLMHRFSF